MSDSLPLLDTDPAAPAISALNDHRSVALLAAELHARSLGLRLVPASCAPHIQDRSRVSAWLLDDGSEMWVGVVDQARPGQVVRAGARLLTLIDGAVLDPTMSVDARVSGDASIESATLKWLAEHGLYSEVLRAGRALLTRLSRHPHLSAADRSAAALHLWSVLVALSHDDRATLLGQCQAIAPQCAELSAGLLEACPTAATPATCRQLAEELRSRAGEN